MYFDYEVKISHLRRWMLRIPLLSIRARMHSKTCSGKTKHFLETGLCVVRVMRRYTQRFSLSL